MGSKYGVAVLSFRIDRPGVYKFSAQYSEDGEGPETVLAVGHEFGRKLFTGVFGILGAMFGAAGIAGAIAVATFLKRRKSSRLRQQSASL